MLNLKIFIKYKYKTLVVNKKSYAHFLINSFIVKRKLKNEKRL